VKEGELSGLPGVFLVYDFSPFLMKQTEQARNPGMMIPIYPNANGHMMSYGYPYHGFSWFFREVNPCESTHLSPDVLAR